MIAAPVNFRLQVIRITVAGIHSKSRRETVAECPDHRPVVGLRASWNRLGDRLGRSTLIHRVFRLITATAREQEQYRESVNQFHQSCAFPLARLPDERVRSLGGHGSEVQLSATVLPSS